jgi:hypothetical protein
MGFNGDGHEAWHITGWYGISSSGCNMRRWTGHFLIAWGSWGIGISNILVRSDGVLDLAILCDVCSVCVVLLLAVCLHSILLLIASYWVDRKCTHVGVVDIISSPGSSAKVRGHPAPVLTWRVRLPQSPSTTFLRC